MHPGKRSALALAVLALAACRPGPEANAYDRYARDWLARPLPADGRMHIQHRGQFVLTPKTIICTDRVGPGLYTDVVAEAVRAVDPRDVLDRAQGMVGENAAQTTPGCDPDIPHDDRIFVRGGERVDDPGYRIWIAVWQGDAVWVGRIERPDGLRPDAEVRPGAIPVNDGPCIWCVTREELAKRARREDSRRLDRYSLSRYFFTRFVKPGLVYPVNRHRDPAP
jgi:hypothetical protein